jgi:hypothetical protein
MGYEVKQIMLSGQEAAGGYNLAVVAVDAAADFATLPPFQDGSMGYIKGVQDTLYAKLSTWQVIAKSSIGESPQIEIDGVNPYTVVMMFRLMQAYLATLATAATYSVLTTRGDMPYRNASAPTRLPKGTSGQVLTIGANDPAWADVGGLGFTDTGNYYTTDTINAAFQQLGALFAQVLALEGEYLIIAAASIPTTESALYEGLKVWDTTNDKPLWCITPGEQENDTVTITAGAVTGSGHVTVTRRCGGCRCRRYCLRQERYHHGGTRDKRRPYHCTQRRFKDHCRNCGRQHYSGCR